MGYAMDRCPWLFFFLYKRCQTVESSTLSRKSILSHSYLQVMNLAGWAPPQSDQRHPSSTRYPFSPTPTYTSSFEPSTIFKYFKTFSIRTMSCRSLTGTKPAILENPNIHCTAYAQHLFEGSGAVPLSMPVHAPPP